MEKLLNAGACSLEQKKGALYNMRNLTLSKRKKSYITFVLKYIPINFFSHIYTHTHPEVSHNGEGEISILIYMEIFFPNQKPFNESS